MRTNIEIDDALMAQALKAGPYKTKKEAVEAGLKLVARQAAYREILKWEGKLRWEGDESIDWTLPAAEADTAVTARETTREATHAEGRTDLGRYTTAASRAPLAVAEPGPGSDDGRR
jgi:Arc/MetJ family transcription regulator